MMAVLLFLACAFIAIGGARLAVAVLDYRDARRLAALRAQQLLAWAETEAAVIAAESQWAHLRDDDGYFDVRESARGC